jgi:hypothetical protein
MHGGWNRGYGVKIEVERESDERKVDARSKMFLQKRN